MNNFELVTIKSIFLGAFLLFTISCKNNLEYKYIADFNTKIELKYHNDLDSLIEEVEHMSTLNNVDSLQFYFKIARLSLKKIEPLLAFYKASVYKSLNQPNLPTLHEDSNGVVEEHPRGFQVMEEYLFSESPNLGKIQQEIIAIKQLLLLEKKNANLSFFKEYHFLWMLRKSLIRVMSMGITGFDSPVSKHSLPENKMVFSSLKESIALYEDIFISKELYKDWQTSLDETISYFDNNNDFNEFDRYTFIRNHLNPLLKLWKKTVEDWQVTFPFPTKINESATSFFSNETFNINSFKPKESPIINDSLIKLGQDLFSDRRLSALGTMSCATCHNKDLYFTDGLPKAIGNDNKPLLRNTPTILYGGLQANQFYDGRIRSLENQIKAVAENEKEFHTNLEDIVLVIAEDTSYVKRINSLYKNGINEKNIRNAIANYIRSLNPFNSKFDKNISGIDNDYTVSEKNGFNLFMGKAQCATCHFAPIFNGTVPPDFSHSEFEVLGVPKNAVFENATIDNDLGRYNLFEVDKRRFAFKTPTIRNIEKTAPYMHNGVYTTLEDVVKFYNLGGGHGIGIMLENQTLPSDSLDLTETEIRDLVSFMNSLTDNLEY